MMKREKVKALIPVFAAYAAGKIIQFNTLHGLGEEPKWKDCDELHFSHKADAYRIKPEPLKVFHAKSWNLSKFNF